MNSRTHNYKTNWYPELVSNLHGQPQVWGGPRPHPREAVTQPISWTFSKQFPTIKTQLGSCIPGRHVTVLALQLVISSQLLLIESEESAECLGIVSSPDPTLSRVTQLPRFESYFLVEVGFEPG